jgi:ribosomal protein L29
MEMLIEERYKDIAQKFFISIEQLKQDSLKSYLLDRKKQLMNERFEILSRYSVINVDELETKIKQGILVEHPSWEDLIDLRNLEAEIQGIKNDISRL